MREELTSLQQSASDSQKEIDKLNNKIDEHVTKQALLKRQIEKLKNSEKDLASKITNAEFEIRKEGREIQSLKSQLQTVEMRASMRSYRSSD